MTIKELSAVAPRCFVFIRNSDGTVSEFKWGDDVMGALEVVDIKATNYPMYKGVLEVETE